MLVNASETLARVCQQAGLKRVTAAGAGPHVSCDAILAVGCEHVTWPGLAFTVTASDQDLLACLKSAATDVDDLWPGRDPRDGTIALLATNLQATLDARFSVPAEVALSSACRWVATPLETRPSIGQGGDDDEWRAA